MKYEDCRFGQIVRDRSRGLGMIEMRIANTQTVNVCFEEECVNMGSGGLILVGHISWVERDAVSPCNAEVLMEKIRNEGRPLLQDLRD